jgi:hypothetical protein
MAGQGLSGMAGMRAGVWLTGAVVLAATFAAASTAGAVSPSQQGAAASDVSSQDGLRPRRARTRIEVYPLPQPLRRECVAVFQERYIPQWGGLVLYPGQRCWWTRAPL